MAEATGSKTVTLTLSTEDAELLALCLDTLDGWLQLPVPIENMPVLPEVVSSSIVVVDMLKHVLRVARVR